jgi:hypothetical protein
MWQRVKAPGCDVVRPATEAIYLRVDGDDIVSLRGDGLAEMAKRHGHIGPWTQGFHQRQNISGGSGRAEQGMTRCGITE